MVPQQGEIEEDLNAVPPQPFAAEIPQVEEVVEIPGQPLIPARPAVCTTKES